MAEQLSGPCCVLCAAMNYHDVPDRPSGPKEQLFHAVIAVLAAVGFIAIFIIT